MRQSGMDCWRSVSAWRSEISGTCTCTYTDLLRCSCPGIGGGGERPYDPRQSRLDNSTGAPETERSVSQRGKRLAVLTFRPTFCRGPKKKSEQALILQLYMVRDERGISVDGDREDGGRWSRLKCETRGFSIDSCEAGQDYGLAARGLVFALEQREASLKGMNGEKGACLGWRRGNRCSMLAFINPVVGSSLTSHS